jgi:hypothetical protein
MGISLLFHRRSANVRDGSNNLALIYDRTVQWLIAWPCFPQYQSGYSIKCFTAQFKLPYSGRFPWTCRLSWSNFILEIRIITYANIMWDSTYGTSTTSETVTYKTWMVDNTVIVANEIGFPSNWPWNFQLCSIKRATDKHVTRKSLTVTFYN